MPERVEGGEDHGRPRRTRCDASRLESAVGGGAVAASVVVLDGERATRARTAGEGVVRGGTPVVVDGEGVVGGGTAGVVNIERAIRDGREMAASVRVLGDIVVVVLEIAAPAGLDIRSLEGMRALVSRARLAHEARIVCSLDRPRAVLVEAPVVRSLDRACVVVVAALERACMVVVAALERASVVVVAASERASVVVVAALDRASVVAVAALGRACVIVVAALVAHSARAAIARQALRGSLHPALVRRGGYLARERRAARRRFGRRGG